MKDGINWFESREVETLHIHDIVLNVVFFFFVCVCVELMLKKRRVLVCYKSLQLQFNIYNMYDVMALCVLTIVKHKYNDVIFHT